MSKESLRADVILHALENNHEYRLGVEIGSGSDRTSYVWYDRNGNVLGYTDSPDRPPVREG